MKTPSTRFNGITIAFDSSCRVTLPADELLAQAGSIIDTDPRSAAECCHNLCAIAPQGIAPLGSLSRVADAKARPLCLLDGDWLMCQGTTLMYRGAVVATLTSAPLCAHSRGSCAVLHLDDGTAVEVSARGSSPTASVRHRDRYAGVLLTATDTGAVEAPVAARKLSGSYPHARGPLGAADRAALDADMADAYRRCAAEAASAGSYCQPVLVRYRLVDSRGATLYVSPVKLLGPASGFQGRHPVTLVSTDGMASREAGTMSLDTWRISVRVPEADSAAADVAALLVEASAPLDAPDTAAGTDCAIAAQTADRVQLSVRFVSATHTGGTAACVAGALARADSLLDVVARFDNPFGGGMGVAGTDITLIAPADKGARVSAGNAAPAATLRRFAAPHSFVARGVSADSDMVVWRGPSYTLGAPGAIGEYLASAPDAGGTARWRAFVAVTMADGTERVVRASSGTGAPSLTLSALLTYPCGDARLMTVGVTDGTTHRVRQFALQRCAGADMAFFLASDGLPVQVDTECETFAVPASHIVRHDCPGMLLIADGERPDEPLGLVRVDGGTLLDVVADAPGSSLWDKTRSRRRVVCDDGVYLLSIGADRQRTGLRRICSERLTAWTVSEDGLLYGATADGCVLQVGDRVCRRLPLRLDVPVTAMAWHTADARLVLLTAAGVLVIHDPATGRLYTRDINGLAVRTLYGGALAATDDGLYRLEARTDGVTRGTRWRYAVTMRPVRAMRPCGAVVDLMSTDHEVQLTMHGTPAAGTTAPLLLVRQTTAGALTSRHRLALYAPPLESLAVALASDM